MGGKQQTHAIFISSGRLSQGGCQLQVSFWPKYKSVTDPVLPGHEKPSLPKGPYYSASSLHDVHQNSSVSESQEAGPPVNEQLLSTRAAAGLCTAEQGQNMASSSRTGNGLREELKCHKPKQGAGRHTLRLKLSSDDMVTRQLGKVINELTRQCER